MPIAALVLGIVGLVIAIVPCLGMFAIPLTLIAVILGVIGMKPPKDGSPQKGKGLAVAGLVMGIIGTLISAYWIYFYFMARGKIAEGFEEGMKHGHHESGMKDFDKDVKDLDKAMKELNNELKPDHPADPTPTPPPAEAPPAGSAAQ